MTILPRKMDWNTIEIIIKSSTELPVFERVMPVIGLALTKYNIYIVSKSIMRPCSILNFEWIQKNDYSLISFEWGRKSISKTIYTTRICLTPVCMLLVSSSLTMFKTKGVHCCSQWSKFEPSLTHEFMASMRKFLICCFIDQLQNECTKITVLHKTRWDRIRAINNKSLCLCLHPLFRWSILVYF